MRRGINNMMITGKPIAAVRKSSSKVLCRVGSRESRLTNGLCDSESATETDELDSNKQPYPRLANVVQRLVSRS